MWGTSDGFSVGWALMFAVMVTVQTVMGRDIVNTTTIRQFTTTVLHTPKAVYYSDYSKQP